MSGKPIPAEKMPRVIGDGPSPFAAPSDYTDPFGLYRKEARSSEALRPDGYIEYDPVTGPPPPAKHDFPGSRDPADDPLSLYQFKELAGAIEGVTRAETHAEAIRTRLRLLTHRQMREFAADLFAAYERLHPQTEPTVLKAAIPRDVLAEVLDRFAHND